MKALTILVAVCLVSGAVAGSRQSSKRANACPAVDSVGLGYIKGFLSSAKHAANRKTAGLPDGLAAGARALRDPGDSPICSKLNAESGDADSAGKTIVSYFAAGNAYIILSRNRIPAGALTTAWMGLGVLDRDGKMIAVFAF
jgi:hypothetical protein